MKIPPWSYSSLSSFETCPKRYYHLKVAKDVIDQQTEVTIWGSSVHKYLENRIKEGTPLPDMLANYEPLVKPIVEHPGEKLIEKQMAVTSDFRATGWWDDTAWCRGIVDVGVITSNQKAATLLDWKTGKRKPNSDQLKLFAALAFAHYPTLETVQTGFVWLKTAQIDKETYSRAQAQTIWLDFAPRVLRLHRAYEENRFAPKPSGLCARYCPVPKTKCEFSGQQ